MNPAEGKAPGLPEIDVREYGGKKDGVRQQSDRRLFMQLLVLDVPDAPNGAGARSADQAAAQLAEQGITANQLQIRWLAPLHGDAIVDLLRGAKRTIIVENNFSGQFARYLRGETSFVPDGHIRKYDGEPFMPHHIVEAVREQLAGDTTLSVPTHEIMV